MQGVNEATFAALGTELSKYYEKEMDAGMRALMDKMLTRNWGLVTHAVVQKTDLVGRTWSSLTANSADDFSASFQSKLRVRLGEYCGNTADMQKLVLKGVAALAKKGLAQIPIPGAGILKTLVQKSVTAATAAVVGAEGGIEGYLHGKSIEEADLVIANRGNKDGAALFRDDREAMAAAEAALAQYKHIANLINSMPSNITSLDEAVQYPGVAAKVRMAASDLRQQLIKVTVFLEGRQARTERVAELVSSDTDVMATKMAAIAKEVVYNTYQVAKADGVAALRNGTYEHRPPPQLKPAAPGADGGVSQLANLVAYAMASGHCDALRISAPQLVSSSNPAVQIPGRARSNGVLGAPPPPPPPLPGRPRRGAVFGAPPGLPPFQ